ncbi:MAG: Lsr2 family protein [Actinomycetes bacterium]
MAQKIHVVLIDDIDGRDADETVRFSLDGSSYEIDLSASNAARLRNAMAEFVGHARKVSPRGGRRARSGSTQGKSAEIRAWAREQGLQVNERGRIPGDLTAKFEAAH